MSWEIGIKMISKIKENVDYSSKVLIVAGLAFIILILITHINNYLKLSGVF